MMLATVITCPQRWTDYQRLRRNFEHISFSFPLRTFQSCDSLESPFVNNILNARAAVQYAAARLTAAGWLLYLEDDVNLAPELTSLLPRLVELAQREHVDCWYLCNRKNPVSRQWQFDTVTINELENVPKGAHALLLPQRHLQPILNAHWGDLSDQCIFRALGPAARIWQVVDPVLAEHIGEISTFNPEVRQSLEINTCN